MIKDTRSEWRKSSHSGGNNGDCVELIGSLDRLRDSKNPVSSLGVDVRPLVVALKAGRLGR
jgi:hypothetical protein